VKKLLKSDNICQSYAQMKKVQLFLTHSVCMFVNNDNNASKNNEPVHIRTKGQTNEIVVFESITTERNMRLISSTNISQLSS